jgi:large conductance mechanosensitive channel
VNSLLRRVQKQAPPDKKKCPECRSNIAIDARRCAFCTSTVV